jgi:hypothetical protein
MFGLGLRIISAPVLVHCSYLTAIILHIQNETIGFLYNTGLTSECSSMPKLLWRSFSAQIVELG